MSSHNVPYTFTPGTKAAAEEVNANFSYLTSILDNIGASNKSFCVNSANRNAQGSEDLFLYSGNEITSKVGENYPNLILTRGDGVTETVNNSFVVTPLITRYASLVPEMTAATAEDISAEATSEADGNEAWHAFDKDAETYWGSFVGVSSASLTFQLSNQVMPEAYQIKILSPASWKLEGSNSGTAWTLLDSYSVEEAALISRALPSPGNYALYKLTVTAGDSIFQVRVAELDLFKRDTNGSLTLPETHILYQGVNSFRVMPNKIFRQIAQPAGKDLYDALIPEMQSNLVPSGYKISASSFTALNSPYLATDGQDSTYWEAADNSEESWFQVQIPVSTAAKVCKLTIGSVDKAPVSGKLMGSNNGSTWSLIYTLTDFTWTHEGETKYLYFTDNATKYSYYRLVCEAPFGSIAEFQLFAKADKGEYLLGEADVNDVWFNFTQSKIYLGSGAWENFELVPAGEVDLDSSGEILSVRTYPYNQNGKDVDALTPSELAGNIVTHDSFISNFGEFGCTVLPNKCMFQWGVATGNTNVLFPAAFPHQVFSVHATPMTASGSIFATVCDLSLYGFSLQNRTIQDGSFAIDSAKNYWIAVGW